MSKNEAAHRLSEEQALYFRAKRAGLAGEGLTRPVATAAAILGAQSQQLGPSLHGLSLRTKGRPAAAALTSELLEKKKLVRLWGQRDTVHVYDPKDWPLVVAARKLWSPMGRRGIMPPESAVEKARALFRKRGEPLTRSDVFSLTTKKMIAEAADKVGEQGDVALRIAAGRFFWVLAQRGEVCFAHKVGAEQYFAAREDWFSKLAWKEIEPVDAAVKLTERYLALSAPATAADVAHFFGARVNDARAWFGKLGSKLIEVECGERDGLVALKRDAAELKQKPPTKESAWPVRLLPMWDSHFMGHADKAWLAPKVADQKQVWKSSAVVKSAVLSRGRIVATWSQKKRGKRLEITLEPLSGWRSTKHLAAVKREAKAAAEHFQLEASEVKIAN